jgi:hypothetical protein
MSRKEKDIVRMIQEGKISPDFIDGMKFMQETYEMAFSHLLNFLSKTKTIELETWEAWLQTKLPQILESYSKEEGKEGVKKPSIFDKLLEIFVDRLIQSGKLDPLIQKLIEGGYIKPEGEPQQ